VLSVVIPTLNAAAVLSATLTALGRSPDQLIVADGGSTDGTQEIAASHGATVLRCTRGRGSQLAAGVAAAREPWLLLLHADTRLAPGWQEEVARHMRGPATRPGYFRFRLDSDDPGARRLERLVAWRCRVLGLPYGDQGLLIYRDLLAFVGGVRPLPLMEDVDLIRRLVRLLGRRSLTALETEAVTSAERWVRDGWVRRSALNLACLALWRIGVPPALVARLYG